MKKSIAILLALALALSGLTVAMAEPAYTAGTYTGKGNGNNGEITVEVTCTDSQITAINIVEQHETYYMFELPSQQIPAEILESQSLAVDTVAGATNSSRGILGAVEDALTQAGASIDQLKTAAEAPARAEQTLDVDAVVVGAGFAGLNAANRLLQNGVNVLLVEQLDIVGGSARFSGGSFMLAHSDETLQAMKDFINTRFYYGDFAVPEGKPDVERVYANMEATRNAYDLYQKLGIDLTPVSGLDYAFTGAMPEKYAEDVAKINGYYTMGSWICEDLKAAYEANGGALMTGTKAVSLIKDDAGKVTGVKAQSDDTDLTINAKAVILATGSYTHNEELLQKYLPARAGDLFCTTIGADGSGIQMALDAGAAMTTENYLNGGARLANPVEAFQTKDGTYKYSDVVSSVAMIVGNDGARLASEVDDRYFRYYSYENELDTFYGIYDTAQLKSIERLDSFEALASDNGPYFKADTLEELAQKCGFDAEKFQNSIADFNRYCETGEDVFELAETAASHTNIDNVGGAVKAVDKKLSLSEGPFYATRLTFVGFDIIGGVETGAVGEVLREDGTAIDGLYAIGFTSSRSFMGSGASHHYCLMLSLSSGFVTADAVTTLLGK